MPKLTPRRWFGGLLLLALALSGCEKRDEVYQDHLLVFGTIVNISLYGVDRALAEHASQALSRQFSAQHHAWSPRENGELGQLNAALAEGRSEQVSDETLALLKRGQALSEVTEELFNPAIGELIRLWGFDHADESLPQQPPAPERVKALLANAPHMSDLRFDGRHVSSRNPHVQLDMGAYAKGYAVDQALAALRRMGIRNAIVEAGGDLRVMGTRGDRAWRVGIRDPRGAGILAAIEAQDGESVFTSGDYERFFEVDGRRYHHIIDPRTGYPTEGLTSVTIIHGDATTADAAATAILVAGPEHWPAIAEKLGIHQVMVLNTQGEATMTPDMAKRIKWIRQPAPPVRVLESP